MASDKNNKELLELSKCKYKAGEGGGYNNVYLAIGDKLFPNKEKGEHGYSGVFHRNKQGTPLFTRIYNGRVRTTFNLLNYVAFNEYDEPMM
jgi:hypothetical protein